MPANFSDYVLDAFMRMNDHFHLQVLNFLTVGQVLMQAEIGSAYFCMLLIKVQVVALMGPLKSSEDLRHLFLFVVVVAAISPWMTTLCLFNP